MGTAIRTRRPPHRLAMADGEALQREGITILDRLRTMADQVHTLPRIGPKMAHLIREELARVTSSRKSLK